MGRAYENRKDSISKTANAKSKIYSKYGRELYVVAKSGGADPDANLSLRGLIDRAKKDQVPAHVIEKALQKATSGAGEDFSSARYEGFGPGNCLVIVDCLTDNPNRTIGDVRVCFNKVKAKIGTSGTVSHMFDHCAILAFAGDDEDAILEVLMNADIDVTDVESEDGMITVFAPQTEYFKTKQALLDAYPGLDFEVDSIQYLPQNTSELAGDDIALMDRFLDMLNDVDDVQNVYHNAEF